MSSGSSSAFGTRRCLVTGGSGFIGTHLLEALVRAESIERIVVLDVTPPTVSDPRIEYLEADLRAPVRADAGRFRDIDACYHLAAVCKEPGFPWAEYFSSNYVGTRHLCHFLDQAGIRNLLFTSTTMVFRAGDERMSEESLAAPDTGYGMSKLLAEVLLEGWVRANRGRRLRIIRPGVVFGRGESANFTRLYYALKRRRFVYIGRRDTIKGCVYVKDVIRCLRILTADDDTRTTYNLVYPDPHTIEGICQTMGDVFGFRRHVPTVPFHAARFAAYGFELLASLGLRTAIHHRRVEKLYYSTNAAAEPARKLGIPTYTLRQALAEWRDECRPRDLF